MAGQPRRTVSQFLTSHPLCLSKEEWIRVTSPNFLEMIFFLAERILSEMFTDLVMECGKLREQRTCSAPRIASPFLFSEAGLWRTCAVYF
jgi:hypothetical protein